MNLTVRDRRIVELRASGLSLRAIARSVGCSETTVKRALAHPALKAAVQEAQEVLLDPEQTLRGALSACRKDGTPDWPTRVSAAKALLAARAGDDVPDEGAEGGELLVSPAVLQLAQAGGAE